MSKPVYGSATAATSLSRRFVPQPVFAQPATPCCQAGAVNSVLHPPPLALNCLNSSPEGGPLSFHTVSLLRAPPAVRSSEVPPTATTVESEAGASGMPGAAPSSATSSQSRYPESPAEAAITTPGWL